MLEGRQRHDWSQTSHLLAMMINTCPNRDPKSRMAKPSDFDPFAPRRKQVADIGTLKDEWMAACAK